MLLSLALMLVPCAASAPQEAATRCARVGADGATARAFFDPESPALLALPAGSPVRVVEVREPWARVQVPGGLDVWVHGDYVTWKGSDGSITRANVNARPLPNTEANSTPLGRFAAGEAVIRVGHEAGWFRVRAHERLGAWVPLARLALLEAEPSGWNEEWKRAADARAPAREEPPAPAPPPAADSEDQAAAPPAEGNGAGGAQARPAAAERPRAFPPAQVAKEPSRWLSLAHQELAALRAELAAGFEAWQESRASELETAFATVLWHGSTAADLESARQGLASLDALRRSYGAWLAAGERRSRDSGDAAAAAAWTQRLEALSRSWGGDGEGGGLLTGWVEARPGVQLALPYQIVRNGQSAVAHDFEDRWRLADFAGREVVARGVWREDPALPGGRLLVVSEVRLLPAKP